MKSDEKRFERIGEKLVKMVEETEEFEEELLLEKSFGSLMGAKWLQSEEEYEAALGGIEDAIEYQKELEDFRGFFNSEYLYTKADILLDYDKPKQALECINECIKLEKKQYRPDSLLPSFPPNPSTEYLKGQILHDLGKYKLSSKSFFKATEIFKLQKIKKDSRDITLEDVYYQIGHNYNHIKKWKEALKWLNKSKLKAKGEDLGFVYNDEMTSLIGLKKYKDALVAARKALRLVPDDGESWLLVAYCLALNKKDPFDVMGFMISAKTLGPSFPDEKDWTHEIDTIRRYLKTVDDDKLSRGIINLKNSFIQKKSKQSKKK